MTATLANPILHLLTADESAAYARDGYHIQRGLLSQQDVSEVLDAFMRLAKNGPIDGLSNVPLQTAATDPLAKFPRMMHPHIHPEHPETCRLALRWLLDRRIEAILSDLMGEPPVAAQSMFYFKPPGSRGQDFHQDNFYLQVAPTTCMAAWIALDAADNGNGGLMVARGSHRIATLKPTQADMSVSMATEHVDIPAGCDVVAPQLAAGDVLFFNGQLVHGSKPNTSADRFRRSLICHYLPSSSTQIGRGYHPALKRFDGKSASFAAPKGEKGAEVH
ncbi:MAG: phytanoyl-CoA dioxygenase family protein [Planctomycetota bacterium]